MNNAETQALPTPPSIFKAFLAGFDAVSNHISLILFSILLDLFLWFGPRLSLEKLISSFFDQMLALPELGTPDTVQLMEASREAWILLGQRYNLFSLLRALPVGIPSLMSSRSPVEMPLGAPLVWEVTSPGLAFWLAVLFLMIGLGVGTLYFGLVAQASLIGQVSLRHAFQNWSRSFGQVLLLTLAALGILLASFVPFSCVLSLLMLSGIGAGRVMMFLYLGLLAWLLMPLVFSPHGIFINGRKMWASLVEGVHMTRMTFPSTGLFLLMAIVLNEGLNLLWEVPLEASWLTLVGIAGHAFIATGLLAASFVYYHDARQWLQKMVLQSKFSSIQTLNKS